MRTVRVVHSSRCNGSPGCYSDRGRSSGKSRDHLRIEAFKTNLIGEQLFYAKINVLLKTSNKAVITQLRPDDVRSSDRKRLLLSLLLIYFDCRHVLLLI